MLSDGAATYTPGISERRAGSSKFLHSGMKNTDAQSGASANVDSSRTYDAFGNLTGSSGTWSGPFGYAGGFGYQEDPDHGLRLLGHRYYDSSTGRFISKDPIGDGRNWTAYCAGNPVRQVDPSGLIAFIPALVWVAGAALTAWSIYEFASDPTVENLLGILPWGKVFKAGKGASAFLAKVLGNRKLPKKYVGMITDAATGWKTDGLNFGIRGSATIDEADELGKIFVGPGYRVSSDGTALVSADGLRVYRKPAYKRKQGRKQANFETYEDASRKKSLGNGHLDIDP